MGPNIRKMTKDDDRIRLMEDTTGSRHGEQGHGVC